MGLFGNKEDKEKLKQVFELVKQGKIKEALEIAETLSDEYKNKIPDSVLFKFSLLEDKSKDFSWDEKKGLIWLKKPNTTAVNKPKEKIKEYIKSVVQQAIEEESASGDAGPYATPYAFKKKNKMNETLETIIKEELLNEVTYTKFKNEVKFRTKNEALHKAIREVKRKLLEVDRLIDYTTRMKQELSESEDGVNYWKRSLKAVDEINETSNRISNKIKSIYQ